MSGAALSQKSPTFLGGKPRITRNRFGLSRQAVLCIREAYPLFIS